MIKWRGGKGGGQEKGGQGKGGEGKGRGRKKGRGWGEPPRKQILATALITCVCLNY
jgi:hypothetical protein